MSRRRITVAAVTTILLVVGVRGVLHLGDHIHQAHHGKQRVYNSMMRFALRDLAVAESLYFSKHDVYTTNLDTLAWLLREPDLEHGRIITIEIDRADAGGWHATIAHRATTQTCSFGADGPLAPRPELADLRQFCSEDWEYRTEPEPGAVEANGSISVSPERDAMYTPIDKGPGGTVVDSVRVTVAIPPQAPGDTFSDCAVCPTMVVIRAGRFMMGSPKSESGRDHYFEGPQHEVRISQAFALGKYEVTRAEYAAFAQETGLDASGCYALGPRWMLDYSANWRNPGYSQTEGDPVVCVSWDDAQKYVRWLNQKTGQGYRLPSESEWEYAARARTTTARYWGESPDEACTYANGRDQTYGEDRGTARYLHDCGDGHVETAPVGSFRPNTFGLSDMLGNAREWVGDCWNVPYSGAPDDGTAWTADDCTRRVVRGGSWFGAPRVVRSAIRRRYESTDRDYISGFRVARTLP